MPTSWRGNEFRKWKANKGARSFVETATKATIRTWTRRHSKSIAAVSSERSGEATSPLKGSDTQVESWGPDVACIKAPALISHDTSFTSNKTPERLRQTHSSYYIFFRRFPKAPHVDRIRYLDSIKNSARERGRNCSYSHKFPVHSRPSRHSKEIHSLRATGGEAAISTRWNNASNNNNKHEEEEIWPAQCNVH